MRALGLFVVVMLMTMLITMIMSSCATDGDPRPVIRMMKSQ